MEDQGVTFNFDSRYKRPVSYTVTISGDQDDYISTIKSLLSLISSQEKDLIDKDELSDICGLIASMLPTPEQIAIDYPNGKTD
jgi:hypothetical protein